MKRIGTILVLLLAVAVLGNVASADTVQYTTTGVFSSGASNFDGFGYDPATHDYTAKNIGTWYNDNGSYLAIRFNSASSLSPNGNGLPSNISLGTFQTTYIRGCISNCNGEGTPVYDTSVVNATGSFTLTIHQSTPSSGQNDLNSIVVGNFYFTGGGGSVTFSQNGTTIGNVLYTLNHSGIVDVNAPGTWLGDNPDGTVIEGSWGDKSSVDAHVSSVPEPASLMLFGSGLMLGGNFIRRKIIAA
jgi:PEP-CTERM motif